MSTTIRDASLTTARRRQLALFGWRQIDQYPQNPQTAKAEQAPSSGNKGTGPSASIPLEVKVGAILVGQSGSCVCNNNVSLAGYAKVSPGC